MKNSKSKFFPKGKEQKQSLIDKLNDKSTEFNFNSIVGGAWNDILHWPESTWTDLRLPPIKR